MPVFKLLVDYCHGDIKHRAFYEKYGSKKYMKCEYSLQGP